MIVGARLQEHVDRAQRSWLLRDDEDWRAFVERRSAPRPPWWTPMGRAAWNVAHASAVAYGRREDARTLTLLPLWFGENDGDGDSDGDSDEGDEADVWSLRRVLVDDDGAVVLTLDDHDDLAFSARVRGLRVTIQVVSRARAYAPGVPGVTHHGPFAVVETLGRFIVDDVADVRPLASVRAPNIVN